MTRMTFYIVCKYVNNEKRCFEQHVGVVAVMLRTNRRFPTALVYTMRFFSAQETSHLSIEGSSAAR
jgi:hypothetical protein